MFLNEFILDFILSKKQCFKYTRKVLKCSIEKKVNMKTYKERAKKLRKKFVRKKKTTNINQKEN